MSLLPIDIRGLKHVPTMYSILPELAAVNVVDRLPNRLVRAALRAALDDLFVLVRSVDQLPAFPNVLADRLLDVDILAGLHRGNRNQRVRVIRRGDGNRVDVLPIEQPAIVGDLIELALVRLVKGFGRFAEHFRIAIAERDQLIA